MHIFGARHGPCNALLRRALVVVSDLWSQKFLDGLLGVGKLGFRIALGGSQRIDLVYQVIVSFLDSLDFVGCLLLVFGEELPFFHHVPVQLGVLQFQGRFFVLQLLDSFFRLVCTFGFLLKEDAPSRVSAVVVLEFHVRGGEERSIGQQQWEEGARLGASKK